VAYSAAVTAHPSPRLWGAADHHLDQSKAVETSPRHARQPQRNVWERLGSDPEVETLGLLHTGRRQGQVSGVDMERPRGSRGQREAGSALPWRAQARPDCRPARTNASSSHKSIAARL